MNEFKQALDDTFNDHDMAEHQQEMLGCRDCYEAIKQAIEKHVIGEDEKAVIKGIARIDTIRDELRAKQRQKLHAK